MEIIGRYNGVNFGISTEFKSEYLTPIIQNLLFKAENAWDDYDEIYHCCKLIESVKNNRNMTMDFHILLYFSAIIINCWSRCCSKCSA